MPRAAASRAVAALVLAAILFVAVNVLAQRLLTGARIDLTAEQLYTLSSGTKSVLARIDEPITLKFYFSKRLGDTAPSFGTYAQRVRELLLQYQALANGKIHLDLIDPAPFSPEEDAATAAGLQGVPLEDKGPDVYFGLDGTNSTDDRQTIAFFQPDRERFLEYDLTKLVQQLAFPRKRVVGLVSTLAIDGGGYTQQGLAPPQYVMQQIRDGFEVRNLGTSFDRVPSDIDLLMIAQPRGLSDATQYALDQFVLGGGHALVFVDPNSEFAHSHPGDGDAGPGVNAADFDRLLGAWGVSLVKGKIVGDRLAARKVSFGGGDNAEPEDYLAWITLEGDDLNHDDPVTGQLGQITLATAGALRPTPDAKTSFEPLLRSSAQSELLDVAEVQGVPDLPSLLDRFKPSGERYVLAARVTGPATTAFPQGPPKSASGKAAIGQAQLMTAREPIDVIVVADSDLLDDKFWLQIQDFLGKQVGVPTSNNADLVANALDDLAGTGALIGLRSRGSAVRPFQVVDDIRRRAEDRYRAKEKELEASLKADEAKLTDLASKDTGDADGALTPAEQTTLDQARAEAVQTRQQLRAVQAALGADIGRLKSELVLFDVVLVPALVALAAIVLGLYRASRRRRRRARGLRARTGDASHPR